MANLTETSTFEPGVYQLETSDPVLGGPGGVSNLQPQQLANRTKWLKDQVDVLSAAAPDMASKAYVQAELEKLDGKQSARAATTAAISLSGLQVIDGVSLVAGERVLVKDQTLPAQNGIYVVAGSGWARAVDSNDSAEVTPGLEITIEEGATNADSRWRLISDGPLILGTSHLLFQNISFGLATIQSPTFTGNPAAPTPTAGDNDTSLATTAFVFNATDGVEAVSVAGGSDVSLTIAQAGKGIIKLTGALSADISVIFPAPTGQWIIENATSGAFAVTAKYAAGTGVILPQGFAVVVYGDATNINFASSTAQAAFTMTPLAPSAGTTVLTPLSGYTPGNILVEKNGAVLEPSDYTATNGATITVAATVAGDTFTIYAFRSFEVANHVLRSGDAMAGPLLLAANSTTPTPADGDSSTLIASTEFVHRSAGIRNLSVFQASGSFVASADCTRVRYRVWGGGGGGGGSFGAGSSGSGGGGGGYCEGYATVTPGASYTITVGASGNGGTNGNPSGNGGSGGGSSAFGSTAGGGGAGAGGTNGIQLTPGAGGSASGGQLNIAGRGGGIGVLLAGGPQIYAASGGYSAYGSFSGPSIVSASSAGSAAFAAGGGGGGGTIGGAGATGSSGLVLVEW